ncbi:MAG: hypothetical protein IT380_24625 [Myxococcales bacterium]|nr:hypothetical protein [Myxococcales bacterium]
MPVSMLITALLAAPLPAPMPGEAEAQRFKDLFERAEAQFSAQDYGAAIALFREADRMRTTPEVAFDLAKCFERLGDEAYTAFYYRQYMKRAPSAPDTLEVAEKVGTTLAQAEADGQGFLELEAPRATRVVIEAVSFPEPPVALFLAPGDYEVKGEFPGGTRTMMVHIATGRTTTVLFEPVQPPLIPLEQSLSVELIAKGYDAPPSGPSKLRLASYLTAGAGVAALVAGIILGVSSSADAAKINDPSLTYAEAQAAADAANAKGIAANILYGVGGAGVAGGAVMFIFSMPEPGMKSGGGGR